eukprot:2393217-Ditylum_brightwellii.AAC.1
MQRQQGHLIQPLQSGLLSTTTTTVEEAKEQDMVQAMKHPKLHQTNQRKKETCLICTTAGPIVLSLDHSIPVPTVRTQ